MNTLTTDTASEKVISAIEESTKIDSPLRREALNAFKSIGLPGAKHEEYKYTPIARTLDKNFTFKSSPAAEPLQNVADFFITGISNNRIVFIDGAYSTEYSNITVDSITIKPLAQAIRDNDATAATHFATLVIKETDALALWNTAAWKDGIFISVPDNVVLEEPIAIYNIANATGGEVVSINRNLIVVGKNSKLKVIEKYDSKGQANHFLNQVTEIVVEENAALDYYSIENDSNNRYQHKLTEIYQKNYSRVNTFTFTLDGKFYRNNLHLSLDGEGIESHMYGLYLLSKETLADNHTVVDHKKPNSYSNELYKGIIEDSSRGVFNGKIYVRPNAQKTNAFQANRNILLSDKATVNTKPQLEIWADDVKCSHGCTTGQLDEEALFYLQSRGIGKETARAMMLYAFAGELIDQIKDDVVREYIDHVISERLHKDF